MKKEYFNDIKVFGYSSQELYPKLNNLDLLTIKRFKNNNIITEDVFRNFDFIELFNFLKMSNKKLTFFNSAKLLDFFQIKLKPFKIINKHVKPNFKQLYIVKTSGEKTDLLNILKYLVETKLKDSLADLNNAVDILYDEIVISEAAFFTLSEETFGIILLRETFTLADFKHEFIHYLEWLSGFYADKIKLNIENVYFENIILFKTLFRIDKNILNYIFDKREYTTLLNEFCELCVKIKAKYFSTLDNKEFLKELFYQLNKDDLDNFDYLEKIQDLLFFNFVKNNVSFMFFIGYSCLNYKLQNIKNHVYGYFKNKKE